MQLGRGSSALHGVMEECEEWEKQKVTQNRSGSQKGSAESQQEKSSAFKGSPSNISTS